MREMETYLEKFRPVGPPEGFRERVLAGARAREEEGWCERQWRSGRFWGTAAAALVALILLNRVEPVPGRGIAPRVEEAPSAFVSELAEIMGDGKALEARLRIQLSGDGAPCGDESDTAAVLRREWPWQS